ncbi:MAG: hypothetical protein ACLQAT_05355 [Candidatus Binataceae bacterium]
MPISHKGGPPEQKLPAYFYRLSQHAQRSYLASDSITRFDLTPDKDATDAIATLVLTLGDGNTAETAEATRMVAAEVCRLVKVPTLKVEVRDVRPKNTRGELHGLFYPFEPRTRTPPHIVLWMRTAARRDVVKPRTFVRTLMHELAHYFDYAVLKLGDSFHTRGFFARESFLVRTLMQPEVKESEGPSLLRAWLDRRARDPDR